MSLPQELRSIPYELQRTGEPWTEDAYFALPVGPGIELVDGALLVSPLPRSRHQRLSLRLAIAFEAARPDGLAVFENVNVRLGPGRVLGPDVVVVSEDPGDVVAIDASQVLLVVEIVSPGSVAADRAIKPQLYAAAGIACYVRVEQLGPTAIVHRLVRGRYEAGRASSVLRLTEPFAVEVDLPAMLAAERAVTRSDPAAPA